MQKIYPSMQIFLQNPPQYPYKIYKNYMTLNLINLIILIIILSRQTFAEFGGRLAVERPEAFCEICRSRESYLICDFADR